ncbi:MAG: hypothetical protein CVV00_12455 [Firmicutes bacterium HGW-Firmicutes-5]|nr:MAG: hypothetical protein CVV00_12455 [Firmicutes bacterium HGW-Firmicutes-5]
MRIAKMITSYDRKSGKVVERKIIDDVEEVDPREFFLPIFETLHSSVLVDAVKAMKNDLYGNHEKGVGL